MLDVKIQRKLGLDIALSAISMATPEDPDAKPLQPSVHLRVDSQGAVFELYDFPIFRASIPVRELRDALDLCVQHLESYMIATQQDSGE